MINLNQTAMCDDVLERESLAWVNRLLSGTVTPAEAEAFKAWRAQSPAHARMFADTIRFRRDVRAAIEAERAAGVQADLAPRRIRGGLRLERREILAGSLAAAVGGYLAIRPPGALWPSPSSILADYRTGTGEQRQIAAAPGIALDLNTQTEIKVRSTSFLPGIALVTGEAEVTGQRSPDRPFAIYAADAHTLLSRGRINVRHTGASVCVTCLEGEAEVRHARGSVRLNAGRQATYTGRDLTVGAPVDPAVVNSWRQGLLVFRDAPLQHVVDELNRYRPGRIVLVDGALARRPVYGVFQIDQIGRAVDQIQRLTGARSVRLPGDIVVLS